MVVFHLSPMLGPHLFVISSTQMATQEVSAGLQDIDPLLPVQIVSPALFSISLAAEVKLLFNIFWSNFTI